MGAVETKGSAPPTTQKESPHITLDGQGESFDTTFNGESARRGQIKPNTHLTEYAVNSPKVLLALRGTLSVDHTSYGPSDIVGLYPDTTVELQTGGDGFEYVSRKASPEIVADTARRLSDLQSVGIGNENWWKLPRDEQFKQLAQRVGETPVEQVKVESGVVSVKRECDNPSGSHYDRAYLTTLRHFEQIGFIKPGDELRDISSGSAGISLAMMAYLLGYKARIMVPEELPANRLYPMLYFRARLVCSGTGYVPAASKAQANEIIGYRDGPNWKELRPADRSGRSFLFERHSTTAADEPSRVCYLNHSENDLTPTAFTSIADELAQQVPGLTHVALAIGNWTTIAGIVPRLRQLHPDIEIIGYSGETTDGSTQNYGTNVPGVPVRFESPDLLDQRVIVSDEQRDQMLSDTLTLGRSSLMGLAVANQVLNQDSDARITTIAYDTNLRY